MQRPGAVLQQVCSGMPVQLPLRNIGTEVASTDAGKPSDILVESKGIQHTIHKLGPCLQRSHVLSHASRTGQRAAVGECHPPILTIGRQHSDCFQIV